MTKQLGIVVLALLISMGAQANHLLPDSVWTFKNHEEHHHTEANEIWLSADRPGAGTGSEVLDKDSSNGKQASSVCIHRERIN